MAPEPEAPRTPAVVDLYVGTIENLFWGNQTRDRPRTVPDATGFFPVSAVAKIDWQDQFTGLFKINRVGLNYARYKGQFFFMEEVKYFGGSWRLYRLVYDVWVNEVLSKRIKVIGTLSKTSNEALVRANIIHTVPVLTSGNETAYINLDVTTEKTPPTFNFVLSKNLAKWDYYLDSKAFEDKFRTIYYTSASKGLAGQCPKLTDPFKLDAVQYASYKWKWFIPLLKDAAQYFRRNADNLKVWEVGGSSGSQAITIHNVLLSKGGNLRIRKGGENKFWCIEPEHDTFLGNVLVSTREVEKIDFSGLQDVNLLKLQDLSVSAPPEKDLRQLKDVDVVDPGISLGSIRGYILEHKTTPQVFFNSKGQRYENKGFRLGQIQRYSEETISGEVKGRDGQTKQLKMLTGLKNLANLKNWNVETTQADFLTKYGAWTGINVKVGDIVIPLDVFNLVHEQQKDRVAHAEAESRTEHFHAFEELDLEQIESLAALEKLANQKVISGDQWYEQTGLAVMPWKAKCAWTIGEIKIESVDIKGELKLSGRTKLYYLVIRPVKLKLKEGIATPNASYLRSYSADEFIPYITKRKRTTGKINESKDPKYPYGLYNNILSDQTFDIFEAWEWFFNSENWWSQYGSKFLFIPKENEVGFSGILIEWPKNKSIPNNARGYWEKFDYKNTTGDIFLKLKNLLSGSPYADVYKVTNPRYLLRKFIKDWDNDSKYNKFKIVNVKWRDLNKPFELWKQERLYNKGKRQNNSLWLSMLVKFYKNQPYRLIIPVKYRVNSLISTNIANFEGSYCGSVIQVGWTENFLIQIIEWFKRWDLMWMFFYDEWKNKPSLISSGWMSTYYPPSNGISLTDAKSKLISGQTDNDKLSNLINFALTHSHLLNSFTWYPSGFYYNDFIPGDPQYVWRTDESKVRAYLPASGPAPLPITYLKYTLEQWNALNLSEAAEPLQASLEYNHNGWAYPAGPYVVSYSYGVSDYEDGGEFWKYWERDDIKYRNKSRYGLWQNEPDLYKIDYEASNIINHTSSFKFSDLLLEKTLNDMPEKVEWWDKTDLQNHQIALFDLVGTNYVLAARKQSNNNLAYALIIKNPIQGIRAALYQSFVPVAPANITETEQIINQFNSLYFHGNIEPLKTRGAIVNYGTELFTITSRLLELEGVSNPYEYRLVTVRSKFEYIKKVLSNAKLTRELTGVIDPVQFEKMQLDHEYARALREWNAKSLENQKLGFHLQTQLAREKHEWQFYGEGQDIWERQQRYQWWSNLASGVLGVGSAAFSFGQGNIMGGLGGLISTAGSFQHVLYGAPDQRAAREHARDMERRQMDITEKIGARGLNLAYEKHILDNKEAERQERLNLVALVGGYRVEPATNYHLHKALIKQLNLNDIHLIVNYPTGEVLKRVKEYYDRNGYDMFYPNFALDSTILEDTGPNIQFSAIDSINVSNPQIRAKLYETFLNGVRIRD